MRLTGPHLGINSQLNNGTERNQNQPCSFHRSAGRSGTQRLYLHTLDTAPPHPHSPFWKHSTASSVNLKRHLILDFRDLTQSITAVCTNYPPILPVPTCRSEVDCSLWGCCDHCEEDPEVLQPISVSDD